MFALKPKLTTTETATMLIKKHLSTRKLSSSAVDTHSLKSHLTRAMSRSPQKPQRCHRTTNNYLPGTAVVADVLVVVAGVVLLLLVLALWPATHHHTLCCSTNKSVAS